MALGKLPAPGRPTIWMTVGQGPIVLAVGAGGGCLDIFTLVYPFSPFSPSLWETARYRLKYCLKGPLNPKQPIKRTCSRQLAMSGMRQLLYWSDQNMVYLAKRTFRKEALEQQCQESGTCYLSERSDKYVVSIAKIRAPDNLSKQRFADAPLTAKGVFLQNLVVFLFPNSYTRAFLEVANLVIYR